MSFGRSPNSNNLTIFYSNKKKEFIYLFLKIKSKLRCGPILLLGVNQIMYRLANMPNSDSTLLAVGLLH